MRPSARARFDAKVDRNGPVPEHRPELGPCHVWTASCKASGYGEFWFKGTMLLAHRVAFFFEHGRWPEPFALHRCDNPPCVNEAHLFEGTNHDNMADMVQKGRAKIPDNRGERHGMSKITDDVARAIKAGRLSDKVSQRELAERHRVSQSLVSAILLGKRWAHVHVEGGQ